METNRFILEKGVLKIKEGVEVISDMEFSQLDIYHVILPKSLKEIKPFTFYRQGIEKITFSEGLEIIGNSAFAFNKLSDLDLPNSITKIGEKAFIDNQLCNLRLPNNLEVIEKETFKDNRLNEITLSSNIKIIKNGAFQNNHIKFIEFNDLIYSIQKNAFKKNKIVDLKCPNSLIEIGENAFELNRIKTLKLPENLKIIEKEVFKFNYIENLILSNDIQIIEESAFYENRIKTLVTGKNTIRIGKQAFSNNKINIAELKDSIVSIEEQAFYDNELENIVLPINLTYLGKGAFTSNKLSSIKFNDKLETISEDVFCDNNLKKLILKAKIIEDCSFMLNNISELIIINTPTKIGYNAFKTDKLLVDGVLVTKPELEKFECENIPKIVAIKKNLKDFNITNFTKEELATIPNNVKAFKSYKSNYKKYRRILKELNLESNQSTFKLAFLLGIFNENKNNLIISQNIFKKFINNHTEKELEYLLGEYILCNYNPKIKQLAFDYANLNNKSYLHLFKKIIFEIDEKYKYILKAKQYKISKNNTKKLKLEKLGLDTREIISTIELQKKNLKNLTMQDIMDYYKTNMYYIKEDNKKLEEITLFLSSFLTTNDFKKIENIYENRTKQDELYFNNLSGFYKNLEYKWLESSDPKNFIIGYEVDCCSKLNESGEDIMIQSITNPKIKNLVIYKNDKIVGKTTAFYNNDYILCNNFEIKPNLNELDEALDILIEALKEQADNMNNKNILVKEVRVGMDNNDLEIQIKKRNLEIVKYNLLDNYKYNNYSGDANNILKGQVKIYSKM